MYRHIRAFHVSRSQPFSRSHSSDGASPLPQNPKTPLKWNYSQINTFICSVKVWLPLWTFYQLLISLHHIMPLEDPGIKIVSFQKEFGNFKLFAVRIIISPNVIFLGSFRQNHIMKSILLTGKCYLVGKSTPWLFDVLNALVQLINFVPYGTIVLGDVNVSSQLAALVVQHNWLGRSYCALKSSIEFLMVLWISVLRWVKISSLSLCSLRRTKVTTLAIKVWQSLLGKELSIVGPVTIIEIWRHYPLHYKFLFYFR